MPIGDGRSALSSPTEPTVAMPVELMFDDRLKHAPKMLWMFLLHASAIQEREIITMTLDEAARLVGGAKNSVITWKDQLEEAGWLEVHAENGLARPSQWRVIIPSAEDRARTLTKK